MKTSRIFSAARLQLKAQPKTSKPAPKASPHIELPPFFYDYRI